MDTDRWEKSQVQLRVGRRKPSCDVDHIVSYSLWEDKLDVGLPKGITDRDDAQAIANKLGNCALLEKNFNISKSKGSLKSFLLKIHEVIKEKIRIDAWCAALNIPKPMLEPDQANVEEINKAISTRDEEIREDLADFVRGQTARRDVETRGSDDPTALSSSDSQADIAAIPSVDRPETTHWNAGEFSEEQVEAEQAPELEAEFDSRQGLDSASVRMAYLEDQEVRLVIDHFGQRERNQRVTPVDTLVPALQRAKTPLSRLAVIRVLRSLDALGLGRFIPGRKGRQTRFEWRVETLFVRSRVLEEKEEGRQDEQGQAIAREEQLKV